MRYHVYLEAEPMRGVQGQNKNETVNMGVYRLNGQLDEQCPVLFPTATIRSRSDTT